MQSTPVSSPHHGADGLSHSERGATLCRLSKSMSTGKAFCIHGEVTPNHTRRKWHSPASRQQVVTAACSVRMAAKPSSSNKRLYKSADPYHDSSFLSFVFFSFVSPLVYKARTDQLTVDDVWCASKLGSHALYERFHATWTSVDEREKPLGRRATVGAVFWKMFIVEFLKWHSLYLLRVACQLMLPLTLRQVCGVDTVTVQCGVRACPCLRSMWC